MDKAAAILVLNACYRASKELGEMGVMMEDLYPDEKGIEIKHQAGRSIAEIGIIIEVIFELHPELERYVEEQIDRFGRVS